MADTEILQTQTDDANLVYRQLVDVRNKKRHEMVRAAEKIIDAELDTEFKDRIDAALNHKQITNRDLEDQRINEGHARLNQSNYGKMVFTEWGRKPNLWFSDDKYKKFRTGRKAVLGVCDRDTNFPGNRRYDVPMLGEIYLRILKKDGTPGLQYMRIDRRNTDRIIVPGQWLAEDERPNNAGEE